MIQIGLEARVAQFAHQLHALEPRLVAQRDHEHIVEIGRCGGDAAQILHHQHALDAHAEAHAGGIRAAQLLHQAVVAAAAADGEISLGGLGDDLEHGLGVVVQAAHDAGIDLVGDAQRLQILLQLLEVLRAVRAEVVQHGGRVGQLLGVLLAVQDAQGIALVPLLTGLAQRGQLGFKVGLQLLMVGLAALRTADGVDAQLEILDAVGLKHADGHLDDLRVQACVLRAEDFDAVLVELAQAAGLGFLVAEAGAGGVVELAGQALVQMVLDEGAHCARGALWLQCDGAMALVLEGVHLLLYHVGGVAHAALEELRVLEDGRADLPVARLGADAAHVFIDDLPSVSVLGQHVQRALGCLGQHSLIPPDQNKKDPVPM